MRCLSDWLGRALFPGSREVPARHVRSGSEDFLDPYAQGAERLFLAGQEFRRQYTDTPLYADSVAATGTDPHNSPAGLQERKGAVR